MIKLFESTDINAFGKFYRIVKKKNKVSKEKISNSQLIVNQKCLITDFTLDKETKKL